MFDERFKKKSREEKIRDNELKRNASGYYDPTAYEAIKNADRSLEMMDSERHYKLIGCILRICELSGFSVEERIVLRDTKTGKVWR